jgi:cell division protein FtsL
MTGVSGIRIRLIVLWMGVALLCASVFSAHVYKQNLYIRLSREAQQLERDKRLRLNEVAALELDVKSLTRRQRLEELAIHQFGLVYTGVPEKVVHRMGGESRDNQEVAMASFRAHSTKAEHWVTGAVRWLTDGL